MQANQRKKVWDLPTRVAHWLLLVLIVYSWVSVEILEDMEQHFLAGYGVLGTCVFRLMWGFVGTYHARFANFLVGPSGVWRYSKTLVHRHSDAYLGHNPMGGWSAILLISVIVIQAGSGLFNSDDYFHGPLSGLVSDATRALIGEIHELNFDVVCALIALHVAAIFFYKIYKRQALTWAMVTGSKPATAIGEVISGSKLILALVLILLSVAFVYIIANGFTDTLPVSEYDYSF